jgi:hypothetical protein
MEGSVFIPSLQAGAFSLCPLRSREVKAESAASSSTGSEEDCVGSAVMYLNNPNAYILAGWKWTQNNPQIKMYLKKDANFNNEGLDAEATKRAIEAAANMWDDAVAQNLFADSNLVTITESANINTDTKDGYNTHGWKPITEGLAVSRTFYSTTKVGGYYPAQESDVTYDSDYNWATNGSNYDVQSVVAHEMGHTIGLGDLYGKPEYAGDTDQVMHYYTGVKRELGWGIGPGCRGCIVHRDILRFAPTTANMFAQRVVAGGNWWQTATGFRHGGRSVL